MYYMLTGQDIDDLWQGARINVPAPAPLNSEVLVDGTDFTLEQLVAIERGAPVVVLGYDYPFRADFV